MSIFTRYAMDALMKTTPPDGEPQDSARNPAHPHPHPLPQPARISAPMVMRSSPAPTSSRTGIPAPTAACVFQPAGRAAVAPSPEQVQRDISPADSDGDTIWIGCEKSTRKNTVVRTCVSAYSWEALAYLALNKKIVLDLTPCRRVRERCLCRASACRSDPAGGVLRPAPVRGPIHAGIRAGRCPLPRQGVLPP